MSRSIFELIGAPDNIIGDIDGKSKPPQIMLVELSQSMVNDLMACMDVSDPPQFVFGRIPKLKYGKKFRILDPHIEHFRHEVYYRMNTKTKIPHRDFAGLINYSLQVQKPRKSLDESDQALENLKNSVASINEQREAEKTIISSVPLTRKSKFPTHNRTPSLTARSNYSASPALSAVGSPPAITTSALLLKSPAVSDMKYAVITWLSVGKSIASEIGRHTFVPKNELAIILKDVAKKTGEQHKGEDFWTLTDKMYRRIDYFSHPFNDRLRQRSIDNAIRAFDRTRLPQDDKLWQILLPKEERGKGKCLSRLGNLSKAAGTPVAAPRKITVDRSGRLKIEGTKDKRPKQPVDDDGLEGKRVPLAKLIKAGLVKEAPASTSTAAKRDPPNNAGTPTVKPKSVKPVQPSTQKSVPPKSTKPTHPSPLSSSPPVNASDFEDNHPVHKRLAASVSPTKKRKPDDTAETPAATPIAKARKITTEHAVATKTAAGGAAQQQNRNPERDTIINNNPMTGITASSSSASHSPSPPLRMSWRQQVEQARKFKQYYSKYAKLYSELADSAEPPTQKARDELMRMHHRLSEMKKEIHGGNLA